MCGGDSQKRKHVKAAVGVEGDAGTSRTGGEGCKEGRILSFTHGSELNDVSLFSTDPLPRAGQSGQVGEGEAFFHVFETVNECD